MNKNEYLKRLGHGLSTLPPDERENVLEYYKDYIADAEDENTLDKIPSPEQAAQNILRESGMPLKTNKTNTAPLFKALFTVFFIIIGIPIVTMLYSIAVSLFIISGVLALSAVILLILASTIIISHAPTSLLCFGISLTAAGMSILTGMLAVFLIKLFNKAIAATFKFVYCGKKVNK